MNLYVNAMSFDVRGCPSLHRTPERIVHVHTPVTVQLDFLPDSAVSGEVEWIDDETLMDAVTAVSGSGPAYVFLLAECLARAGVAAGLPPELAAKLARETIAGAGELLHRSADEPATLRQNVTSPGGTTAAALARTVQLESVCDTCNDVTLGSDTGQDTNLVTLTNSSGLGVRFNGDQCSVCHQQPAIGGSGGFLVPNPQDSKTHQRKPENPMFDLIPHRKGGQNYVPSFITQYGPILQDG
jgi:hypothetical protein